MDFLKPKPVRRQKWKKSKPINSFESNYKKNIFDKIRDLCQTPKPIITPIDDVKAIFDDMKSLCRIPLLLTPIEDLIVSQIDSESKPNKRTKKISSKQYYRESDETENTFNSFENINQSKLFCALVRGKHSLNNINNRLVNSNNKLVNNNNKSVNNNNNNMKTGIKKRPKTNAKTETKVAVVCRPKPLLSIDCDINAKINEYSKEYSKPKLKSRKSVSNCCQESSVSSNMDSSDSSTASHSFANSVSYSMPATPISSTDTCVNSIESTSTQSLLNRLRNTINYNIESYRQYYEREVASKTSKRKRPSKDTIDFKQKVLEWKANRISSGNTTPVHNIEYLVTPPGSPSVENRNSIDEELSAIITNFEDNNNNNDFNLSDNMINEFNTLLLDLYTDIN